MMHMFRPFSFLLTAALVAGCGALSQPSAGGSSSLPAVAGAHSDRGRSWMSAAAKKESLIYISSVLTNDVYAYSYKTHQLDGTLTGFSTPYGLCVDKKDDVWIVNDGASQIVEYVHGGTSPMATLSDPGEYPEGCSVDPTTGNLAVTNFYSSSGAGSVSIYAGAQGSPQNYSDPSFQEYRFCGYDSHGNLFLDGVTPGSAFAFAELPKGSNTFNDITLSHSVEWPGGVQWDGKYIAVGDTDAAVIYRATSSGTVIGTVTLSGGNYVNQFWLSGSARGKKAKHDTAVAPSQDGSSTGIYKYPAGGAPVATITVEEPFGAAVSP